MSRATIYGSFTTSYTVKYGRTWRFKQLTKPWPTDHRVYEVAIEVPQAEMDTIEPAGTTQGEVVRAVTAR